MQIKIHEGYRKTVALSDTNLIGKEFSEDIKGIKIRENFFKGEEKNKQETIQILKNMAKEDVTFNIVGEESIKTALEAGIIDKKGIIKIDNVPIALILL